MQHTAAASGKLRTYALAGLDGDAGTALRCMMDVLRGRVSSQWVQADAGKAEVLFMGAAAGGAISVPASVRQVVHVKRSDDDAAGFRLQLDYPFRVFQVLGLMQELELDGPVADPAAPAAPPLSHPSWALFDALHALSLQSGSGRWWKVDVAEGESICVRDDLREFAASPGAIAAIRRGDVPQAPLEPCDPPPASLPRQDGFQLLWQIGLNSGRGQLSATLESDTPYRLRLWPDFGRIRPERLHLRMSALMTAEARTRDELVALVGQGDEAGRLAVNRYLNACAASGLLKPEHRPERETIAPPRPAGFMTGLMSKLRGKLGLAATDH